MILHEELYFEITLKGEKSEIKKFAKFLNSGELDDFFEIDSDYLSYGDEYTAADDGDEVEMVFTNDDLGIEIGRFDVEEFLDVLCHAAKKLDVVGHVYDINDEEFSFSSATGSADFKNLSKIDKFNDELDEEAASEESENDDSEDNY